jgi:transposase
MIPIPSGIRVWLATGHTDMRKGFPGLALLVQETLARDPHGGQIGPSLVQIPVVAALRPCTR